MLLRELLQTSGKGRGGLFYSHAFCDHQSDPENAYCFGWDWSGPGVMKLEDFMEGGSRYNEGR